MKQKRLQCEMRYVPNKSECKYKQFDDSHIMFIVMLLQCHAMNNSLGSVEVYANLSQGNVKYIETKCHSESQLMILIIAKENVEACSTPPQPKHRRAWLL